MRHAWLIVLFVLQTSVCFAARRTEFSLRFDHGRLVFLGADSKSGRNFLAAGASLGDVRVVYRTKNGAWIPFETASTAVQEEQTGFNETTKDGLQVTSAFSASGHRLVWTITLNNRSDARLEIGDLCFRLPIASRFGTRGQIRESFMKHSFISGAGSFIYWESADATMPRLVMTTGPDTSLEYWDAERGSFRVFCHSAAQAEVVSKHEGTWRIPRSSKSLAVGKSASYSFNFDWATSDDAVRDVLVDEGTPDIYVVPGMTVPTDLPAEIAVRSRRQNYRAQAEHPEETRIEKLGGNGSFQRFRIRFQQLGENLITLRDPDGHATYMEFFVTQPIETLIKKRAAFLTKCQHNDPTKWYRGLISEWNMDSGTLLGPDNYDRITGWRIYEVSCDDPGLGKPSFLASKNAEYPVQSQVTALDDYIQYFVWGGLQQTPAEAYPYAIYGIPDWKTNRQSKSARATDGVAHLWRCYDYPHVILLYFSMYRIARDHPEIKTRLAANEYLARAYGTAKAMYTVPLKLRNWSPYDTGYYNECIFPNLIDALAQEGMQAQSNDLRAMWDRKVRTFLVDKPDLFASEYPFDSTGFESTGAIAAYAKGREAELGVTSRQVRDFTDRQIAGNLFCRGRIEPAYYLLGSDYRGAGGNAYTLSYMSQMGGGYVLDYGLHDATDDSTYLRLGYASLLSSWALMNTGTAACDYGYWYPGKQNDGGAGGGFEPASYGMTWLGQPNHRGSWYYGCEVDLGYSGYLRKACTVLADDPIFGTTCFGGTTSRNGWITPEDGVRRRFYVRTKRLSLDLELTGAKFSQQNSIRVDSGSVKAVLVTSSGGAPTATVGAVSREMQVSLDGKIVAVVPAGQRRSFTLPRGVWGRSHPQENLTIRIQSDPR